MQQIERAIYEYNKSLWFFQRHKSLKEWHVGYYNKFFLGKELKTLKPILLSPFQSIVHNILIGSTEKASLCYLNHIFQKIDNNEPFLFFNNILNVEKKFLSDILNYAKERDYSLKIVIDDYNSLFSDSDTCLDGGASYFFTFNNEEKNIIRLKNEIIPFLSLKYDLSEESIHLTTLYDLFIKQVCKLLNKEKPISNTLPHGKTSIIIGSFLNFDSKILNKIAVSASSYGHALFTHLDYEILEYMLEEKSLSNKNFILLSDSTEKYKQLLKKYIYLKHTAASNFVILTRTQGERDTFEIQ